MKHTLLAGLWAAPSILFLVAPSTAQSADADLSPALVPSGPRLADTPMVMEPVPLGGFAPRAVPPAEPPIGRRDQLFPGADPDLANTLRIDDLLQRPLVDRRKGDDVWVRTLRQRTHFAADGVTVFPVFGPDAPNESPLKLEVVEALVGSSALSVEARSKPLVSADDRLVDVQRADFVESWILERDSIEQTFTFHDLPERGELSVTMQVTTDLVASEADGTLRFEREGLGGVTYGAAFAYDAKGRRTPVRRSLDGDRLTLTVPADFVVAAELPLTIDPPISSWVLSGSFADDRSPAVCFTRRPGRYFVTWEEYTSQTNSDCYLTSFTQLGFQGAVVPVETGSDFWERPRIAYVPANDRLLIVASASPNGPGSGFSRIEGRIFRATDSTAATSIFPISTAGSEKVDPVVGGTNLEGVANNYFLVAWSRVKSTTRFSIEYRLIAWDSFAVTQIETLAETEGFRNLEPAVSASHGDSFLVGDFWTVAWTENVAGSFFLFGRIKARRIRWDGLVPGSAFTVNDSTWCSKPSVSSQLDSTYGVSSFRPSIVAYGVIDPANGLKSEIHASVVSQTSAYPASNVTAMEDFKANVSRAQPTIGTDGSAFVLAYQERHYLSSLRTDFDVFMASGSVVRTGSDLRIALSERHQLLSSTTNDEFAPQIAMERDAHTGLSSDSGLVVWYRDLDNPGGEVRGSRVHAETVYGRPDRAVGRQYCSANTHSGNVTQYGPDTSWLWISGNASVQREHRAYCVGMPDNTFGYLICSTTQGNVNMPAGSRGRLCLGGSVGRYTDQIRSSGTAGEIVTFVDPDRVPQPNGNVAVQPGETWNFQLWHRDAFITPTSNFSNACSVEFLP
ncbi:MAG: hypothetical protein AAGA20_15820 [Planctomycetota bacterium]